MIIDHATQLEAGSIAITATSIPHARLVAVFAEVEGRRLSVVWDKEGTGYPVIDELSEDESDAVFNAVSEAWPQ
jgi:hypothetical protein